MHGAFVDIADEFLLDLVHFPHGSVEQGFANGQDGGQRLPDLVGGAGQGGCPRGHGPLVDLPLDLEAMLFRLKSVCFESQLPGEEQQDKPRRQVGKRIEKGVEADGSGGKIDLPQRGPARHEDHRDRQRERAPLHQPVGRSDNPDVVEVQQQAVF